MSPWHKDNAALGYFLLLAVYYCLKVRAVCCLNLSLSGLACWLTCAILRYILQSTCGRTAGLFAGALSFTCCYLDSPSLRI